MRYAGDMRALAAILSICTAGAPPPGDPSAVLAIPQPTGPARTGRAQLAGAVFEALEAEGFELVRGRALGKRQRSRPLAAARSARTDYLLELGARRRRGGYVATARIRRVMDGTDVLRLERRYRRRRDAAAAGRGLAETLVEALWREIEARPPRSREEAPAPAPPATRAASEPAGEAGPPGRASPPVEIAPSSPPSRSDQPEPKTQLAADTPSAPGSEPRWQLFAAAGTRVASSYTLAADARVSLLSYSLDPLLAVEAGFRYRGGGAFPLEATVEGGLSPVRFGLGIEASLIDPEPSGLFARGSAQVGWRFALAEGPTRFSVAPRVGATYEGLNVDGAGARSVVNGWSSLSLDGGLEVVLGLDALEVRAGGLIGPVLGFSEGPVATGQSASGFRFGGGLELQWWMLDALALEVRARWIRHSLGFDGRGTRPTFDVDPALIEADLDLESLDLVAGLTVGFGG